MAKVYNYYKYSESRYIDKSQVKYSFNGLKPSCFIILVLFLLNPFYLTAQNCPPGLVHHFGMDEATNTTAYEDYVSATTAECQACPSPTNGAFAGAQQFDGKDDGLNINAIKNFEWGPNSDFTIELWMQLSGTSSTSRVAIGRVATDSKMVWWIGADANGYAVFELRDRQRKGFSMGHEGIKVNDGKWHHVAIVRDGRLRRNKLYVDGYTVGNFEFDYSDNFESVSPVNIGYLDVDNRYRFDGKLDEIMVYNRALGETEMRARYNHGAGNYCGPKQVKPEIVSDAITFGVVDQQYQYDVNATGTPSPNYTLVASPAGMAINAATGQITWIPKEAGSYNVTVKAANNIGESIQTYKIEVKKSLGEKAGLIHHWMLHETTGIKYNDFYTPYIATCTEEKRPKPINGAISGGQQFDGKDDGLDIQESYNFDWEPNASFSIELWMRTSGSTAGNRVLIGRDAKDSEAHWWLGVDAAGKAAFNLLDLNWQGVFVGNSGPKLNNGIWHQLVAVRDGNSGRTTLYVDGEPVASGTHTYKDGFESRTPVNIGYLNDGNGYHYEGDLDEVKLFGRVLSADEIKSRYQQVFDGIIDLLSFNGKYVNGSVVLDWSTASESGLKTFEIERSQEGEFFEKIGEEPAKGNSNVQIDYTYTDTDPLRGKSYYRLKIIKESGAINYSNIIEVENNSRTASTFIMYPNPASLTSEVLIEITNLREDESAEIMISDLAGSVLIKNTLEIEPNGSLKFTIPVSHNFRSGIYNVSVTTSKKTISRKLVILR